MKSHILFVFLSILFVSACSGTMEVGIEHSPTVSSSSTAISTLGSTRMDTLLPPSATDPQPLSTIPVPVETTIPTDLPTQNMVQIYLIAVDDNGQSGTPVGCGDSVIPVQVEIPPTQGVLKAALVALLTVKNQYYGQSGLYNALYQSDLEVESLSINGSIATVYLTGTLRMGGECDAPRVQAQLEQTILQFQNVTGVTIFINGKPLGDVLSLKG